MTSEMTSNIFFGEIPMPHHCCIYLRIKISHPLKKLTKYEGSYDFFPTMAVTSYLDLGPWHKITCLTLVNRQTISEF